MDTQVLAEVVEFAESRDLERIERDGRIVALKPGKITSTITLAARGRKLTFEVPEKVISFLTGT